MTIGPFEAVYRVRFDEAGPDGLARASVLLRYAHDVAWRHSAHLGFDRAWYVGRGLLWLVRTIDLDYRAAVTAGSDLVVDTEVTAYGRIWARRRSAAWVGERGGEPAAVAVTDWVLIDARGRPTRLPGEFLELFGAPTEPAEIMRVAVEDPPGGVGRVAIVARHHELDPNGHVNNAVHLDWIDEVVRQAGNEQPPPAQPIQRLPRRYLVEYLAALAVDERAELSAWAASDGWSIRLQRPDDGRELARARLIVGERGIDTVPR